MGAARAHDLGGLARLRLAAPGVVSIAGQVLDKEELRAFYAIRGYRLAWDGEGVGLEPRASVVVGVLMSADREGLDPAEYHVREIAGLAAAQTDGARIDRDLLITDGLLHYAADVALGRLTPRQTDERVAAVDKAELEATVAMAAGGEAAKLADFLAGLAPASPEYQALKGELAELRAMADAGGWESLPDGPSLRPGARDSVVPFLRRRLQAERWIGAATPSRKAAGNQDLYDSKLSGAVAAFQAVHGIKPDGVVGKDTRAALDVPLDARMHQAIANMERIRWGDIPREGRVVEVNLAAYSLVVYQDGAPILTMPVVVGSSDNPTPIISTRITTVVLNPNWTLPPNVIKEILPRIHGDASYLAGRGIARIEEDGKVRLVQPPGPTNPLGHYKFIMPNDQDIYLHDSPDVVKFRYALRAYSHGCVRLGDAAALATLLLDDRVATLPDSLDALVQTGSTRHIALSKPVPVSFVYRTAWVNGSGRLIMGKDTYDRDQRIWKALHKPRTAPVRRFASTAGPGQTL
jgi:murein L,D-transpeptidase YcbB/YkuD